MDDGSFSGQSSSGNSSGDNGNGFGGTIDKIQSDIADLYGWIDDIYSWLDVAFTDIESLQNSTSSGGSQSDITSTVKEDIR